MAERTVTLPAEIADALQSLGYTIPQGDEVQACELDAAALGLAPGLLAGLLKAVPALITAIGGEKFKQIVAALPALISAALAKDWATLARLVAELLTPKTA